MATLVQEPRGRISPSGTALAVGCNVAWFLSKNIKIMLQMYSRLLSHHCQVMPFCALCSITVMTVTDSFFFFFFFFEFHYLYAKLAKNIQRGNKLLCATTRTYAGSHPHDVQDILDLHFARHVTYVCLGVEICLVGRDKQPDRHM